MVVVAGHLGFHERQGPRVLLNVAIAREPIALLLPCVALLEETGIIGLVEHAEELDAPRITALPSVLVDQDRDALVDALGHIPVALRAEDGAGKRVGVHEFDVSRRQNDVARLLRDLFDALRPEDKVHPAGLDLGAAEKQHAEFQATLDIGEQAEAVDEIVDRREGLARHEFAEKLLGRMVRGDAAGQQQADPAAGRHDPPRKFREEHIEIDVAFAGEREPGVLGTDVVRASRIAPA